MKCIHKCFKFNKVCLHKISKIILLKIYREEKYYQPPVKQVSIKATNKVDFCHLSYLNSQWKFG